MTNSTDASPIQGEGPRPEVLLRPRDGVPEPVASASALRSAVRRLAAGDGPVAIDAERASGYRYGQRAYLVQIRRAGVGTVLIDPIACPDLSPLDDALADAEWILHAATQDLPCLAGVGMRPRRLFDTELAGRLLGHPRVSLAAMCERLLGVSLEKGHGAADWSTRPLPAPWLSYAALDVELLIDLRATLVGALAAAGKLDWARQEFAALVTAPPPPVRPDGWRRTSGIHRVHGRRQLAAVRSLWTARDAIARTRDLAPGRVMHDSAIIDIVLAEPASYEQLRALPALRGRNGRQASRFAERWWVALSAAKSLASSGLPEPASAADGVPPPSRWASRDPVAAGRLAAARAKLAAMSERLDVPVENLVPPDAVRRISWRPPDPATADAVRADLTRYGARAWQVDLVAVVLAAAMADGQGRPPTASIES